MRHTSQIGCIGLILALWALPAWALELGDPAPALQIGEWVKNGPVDLAKGKGKNIYVIEFWATWCGPCLTSIPHLTELQKEYKDKGVVIIGISDEPAATVKPFVERMGDKMGYAVAADQRGTTYRTYMGGFGVQGIPHSFVIDKSGAIAWQGHPLEGLDKVIERMVAGKYDIKQAKDEAAALKLMNQYFGLVESWNATKDQQERNRIAVRAKQTGEEVIAKASRSPNVLDEFASTIVLAPGTEYRDLELAGRAAEAAYKASEQKPADKARKLMHDYFRTLREGEPKAPLTPEKKQKLDTLASQIIEQAEPDELKTFAWVLMIVPELENRDLPLALRAADAARTKTKDQDATVLDTYARALFENGQRDKAVQYAKKALEINEDERLEPVLKQSLQEYEKAGSAPSGK